MHFQRFWGLAVSLSSLGLVSARLPDGRPHGNIMRPASVPIVNVPSTSVPVTSRNGTVLPPYTTRFWHTWEFYEPGGPIILFTPGEINADAWRKRVLTTRWFTSSTTKWSTIVLEHRFYGLSNPYPDLSVKSLKNVNLPMPGGDSVTPDKAPWVLIGGSYSGTQTKPGLFAAGYASSAVVEAILDFWKYFEPIPVISHVDKTFTGKNPTAIQALKNNFGLGNMTHLDDVAGALRNNLWDWQSLQITSGPGAQFFNFCDALEVKDGQQASATGWGVDHALAAWGNYWRTTYLSICDRTCLGTYDTSLSFWTDTSIDNSNRSWMWIVCNEVGFLQEGAPTTSPTLVTRLVQPPYDLRQCQQMFPAAFPVPPVPNTLATNTKYRGWNVRIQNLFFANGVRDPWRDATVSADGLNVQSTASQPIAVGDGFHCSDLGASAAIDPTIAAVQTKALASMKTWLAAWKPKSNGFPVKTPRSTPAPSTKVSPPVSPKPVNAWFKKVGNL
ncbi:serine carboxypeptidase S28-domain-containing protein [Flammula alnicola]|nr:serine carboxypeptidase S28-domain-containing protein [Flammula alnicola]